MTCCSVVRNQAVFVEFWYLGWSCGTMSVAWEPLACDCASLLKSIDFQRSPCRVCWFLQLSGMTMLAARAGVHTPRIHPEDAELGGRTGLAHLCCSLGSVPLPQTLENEITARGLGRLWRWAVPSAQSCAAGSRFGGQ